MSNKKRPSCFTCKHALINPGYPDTRHEPGEPMHMEECHCDEVNQDIFEEDIVSYDPLEPIICEEIFASRCGHFDPKLHTHCANCNTEINSPEWSHEHYAFHAHDDYPSACCSPRCKEELQVKFDRDFCIEDNRCMKCFNELPWWDSDDKMQDGTIICKKCQDK